jgi:hypothetical protein
MGVRQRTRNGVAMPESMKALSIDAPWAWAIVRGHKRWENRSWATRHRGRLWIHATQARRSDEAAAAIFAELAIEAPAGDALDALRGRVLGYVDLLDCVPYPTAAGSSLFEQEQYESAIGISLRNDPFAMGPVCWQLDHPVELIAPLAIKGKQGMWTLPAGLVSS